MVMRRSRLRVVCGAAGMAVGVSVVAIVATSCSGGGSKLGFGDDTDAGADGDIVEDDAAVPAFGDSSADGVPGCAVHCSSDLHTVLDCQDNVIATCGDTEGCDATVGRCVTACDAANAARGSIGCEFYPVSPPVGSGSCFAVYVANTWSSPVTLSVEYQNVARNVSTFARIPAGNGSAITYTPLTNNQIPAGSVAILFIAGSNCPGGVTTFASHSPSTTGLANAVRIATDRPVAAYDIYPYGGGSSAVASATLLLPTSAWATNYVAGSPFEISTQTNAPNAVQIVGKEDGTTVTVLPLRAIVGGAGVPAAPANQPVNYTVNKGQILSFIQGSLLDGSPIQSNKPIGVWASMNCFNVPQNQTYCDSAHQQIPPVQALGSEYALVRYRNRVPGGAEETPPWRLLGLVDNTTLTWQPQTPPGAPTSLKAGQLVTFSGSGPYVVQSQDDQHPFYVSAHMTGCSTVGTHGQPPVGCAGDAEYVNVVPAKEFQDRYVFFTDPTYPETNLVVVRSKAGDGTFKDVELDCAGALTGWQPIGSGEYEYTRTDLVRGNFAKQGNCDNGRHEIKSRAPFGITVWGWGSKDSQPFFSEAVSYAYPGGMSLKAINTVVIPPTPR